MAESCDAVIIGGGFYGLYLAEYLAARVSRVVLLERESELMCRASYHNQARVHNGYHYPRSLLTALRSRVNFARFVKEFRPAVDSTFEAVYAVSRRFSKVTAGQFFKTMQRIGAPIAPARKAIAELFDPLYVEAGFVTEEYAFNAVALRDLMIERVRRAGVDVRVNTLVQSVGTVLGDKVRVQVDGAGGAEEFVAGHAFCCGYSGLNSPGAGGALPMVVLKHELAEMALVEPPDELRGVGVTIMDGPFFSLMPFPARGLYSFSHVRYTPHVSWYDGKSAYCSAYDIVSKADKRTNFPSMVKDATRYLPSAAKCLYRDSLWQAKTVLPRSEADDSRPILFRPNFGIPGYHLIMGGKIDNVYDIADILSQTFGWRNEAV